MSSVFPHSLFLKGCCQSHPRLKLQPRSHGHSIIERKKEIPSEPRTFYSEPHKITSTENPRMGKKVHIRNRLLNVHASLPKAIPTPLFYTVSRMSIS